MTDRYDVLENAIEAVGGRGKAYGEPTESLQTVASLWTIAFGHVFHATDIALAMVLLKAARLSANRGHQDSWVDVAGYASLGAEIASTAGYE